MERLKGKTVLVTGSEGFIGSALRTECVRRGARVVGVDIAGGGWFTFDVCDQDKMETLVAATDPDIVFHLAALSQVTEADKIPAIAFENNAWGTVSVLEAVRVVRPTARVIVSTSDKVYGSMGKDEKPMGERRPLKPRHPYDASKAAADIMAQSYSDFYGLNLAVARLCNVYGWGDKNWRRIVPSIMADIAAGRPPRLRSDGKQVREYIYIDDAVEALIRMGLSDCQGVYNIGGVAHTALEVCRMVQEAMSTEAGYDVLDPVIENVAQNESDRISLDSSRAIVEAITEGPDRLTPTESGIARTVNKFLNEGRQ